MNLGFAGMGAKGVYDDASHAYQQYDAGDTDGALESLGAAVPNAALTLPALAPHIETFGDATQDAGVNLMDSYLKAGKRAYRYDAQPGRGILDEGPGTSIGLTRQGFSDKVAAAKAQAGAAIPDIVNTSTAQIPRSELADNVNSVISRKNTVLTGAGGNPDAIAPLDTLAATFDPHTQAAGNASLAEVYGIKRNQDKNINWSRDIDPIAATRNNANREIRSNMAQSIYAAEPALEAPSQQYSNLASAAKLADARTYDTNGSVFNPFRLLTGTVGGIAAGELTHNPVTGLMTGIATNVAPELWKSPAAKTTAATALFQGGKGISAFGRALQGIPGMPQLGTTFSDTNQYPQEYDGTATSAQNQAQHLPLPGTGVYARTNVTPEIIRPGDMSRSQIGVGPDGRAGVMIRPLAALPAPVPPVPEATPYTFEGPKLGTDIAIPQRSPMALQNSIGSSAHTIPASLLGDILPQGTPEEQAAALRLASLGSRASVVPLRSVIANPNSQPHGIGGPRLK
ncbi:MAG TPA: hypothetical protein VGU23_08480 [Acidobacteriaceae bacterium]|nr:hypothetical protein [Acidobacteriaceae bacterium]